MKTTLIPLAVAFNIAHVSTSPLLSSRANTNTNKMICNKAGWDAGRESFTTTSDYTYPACSAACFNNPKCKSFAYDFSYTEGGSCQLYDVPLKRNFAADESSPFVFYDTACEKKLSVCGEEGLYTGQEWDVVGSADTYDHPEQQSASACYDMCKGDPSCKAYSWSQYSCILYDVPLTGNFKQTFDGETTLFWDLTCGEPASSGSESVNVASTSVNETITDASSSSESATTTEISSTTATTMITRTAKPTPTTTLSTTVLTTADPTSTATEGLDETTTSPAAITTTMSDPRPAKPSTTTTSL